MKGPYGFDRIIGKELKDGFVDFNEEGCVFISFEGFMLADSFILFEKNGNKEIIVGNFVLNITRLTSKELELSLTSPLENSGGITLSFTKGEKPNNFLKKKLYGMWKYGPVKNFLPEDDHFPSNESQTNQQKNNRYINLKDSGSLIEYNDTIPTTGKWTIDENTYIITLITATHVEKYFLKTFKDRNIVLQKVGGKKEYAMFTHSSLGPGKWRGQEDDEYGYRYNDSMRLADLRLDSTAAARTYDSATALRTQDSMRAAAMAQEPTPYDRPQMLNALLINKFTATSAVVLKTSVLEKLENPTSIQLDKDMTYTLVANKKTVKGHWEITGTDANVLLLEMEGKEQYCPFIIFNTGNGKLAPATSFQLTVDLPGNDHITTVYFVK